MSILDKLKLARSSVAAQKESVVSTEPVVVKAKKSSTLLKMKRVKVATSDTNLVEQDAQHKSLPIPSAVKQTKQESLPSAMDKMGCYTDRFPKLKKDTPSWVMVGRVRTKVIEDLSIQYVVEFPDGKQKFVFKRDVKLCKTK